MNWKVRSSPTEKKTTTQANKDRNEVKREIMIAKKKRKRNQSTWLRAASISMALIRSEWVVRLGKNWRPWEHRSSNDSYVINVKSSSNPTGTGQRRATTTTATDNIVWVKKKNKRKQKRIATFNAEQWPSHTQHGSTFTGEQKEKQKRTHLLLAGPFRRGSNFNKKKLWVNQTKGTTTTTTTKRNPVKLGKTRWSRENHSTHPGPRVIQ